MVVSHERLKEAATAVLRHLGAAPGEAALAAESLVLADMRGIPTHGTVYLKALAERVKAGMVALPTAVTVVSDAGAVLHLDGGNGLGQPAAFRAMDACIERARSFGAGAAAVRNTNNVGHLAFYATRAARAGCVGIVMTNAAPAIAPWGGAEAFFGTNPFSIAVPGATEGECVALDMSSSIVARGKVRRAERLGEAIPEGWALDGDGRPTTDATAALAGTILPVGGPKGYGLALMVDVLAGMLSGSAFGQEVKTFHKCVGPTGVGAFALAVDVSRFMPLPAFRELMAGYCASVRGAKKAGGVSRIYLPGEIEFDREKRSEREGVTLDAATGEFLSRFLSEAGSAVRLE